MYEIKESKKAEEQYSSCYKMNKFILMDKFNHIISKPFVIIKNTEKEVLGQMISDTHYNSVIPCYKDIEFKFVEFDKNQNNVLFEFNFIIEHEKFERAFNEIKKINKNIEKQTKVSQVIVRKKENFKYENNTTEEVFYFSFEIDMTVRIVNEKDKLISLTIPSFGLYF